jgi:vacuolar-type H+-ATPase subunit C/Vma6
VRELSGFLVHVPESGASFLESVLARFQVENVKVLLRIVVAKTYEGDLPHYIVPVPREAALNVRELAAAESLEDFVRLTPKGLIRDSLRKALEIYHDFSQPFFFEAALDQAYFQELIARVDELSEEDREIIKPMACQEADIFHLMLTVRGKFNYGLGREMLLPLHVGGTRIPRSLFAEMLGDSDFRAALGRAVGKALDTALPEGGQGDETAPQVLYGGVVERLAWKRFLRLANLAFRRSHMGLGAIAGYAGLRRVEVANLITVSEGIERGVDAETIRAHLIRGAEVEAVHV